MTTYESQISDLYQLQLGSLLIAPAASARSTATAGDVTYVTNPFIQVTSIDGLLSLPDVSANLRKRLRTHGLREGDAFLDGRTLTITMEVEDTVDDSGQYLTSNLADLLDNTNPTETVRLFFRFPQVAGGTAGFLNARVTARTIQMKPDFVYGYNEVTLQLVCPDPRIYEAQLSVNTATLPTSSGGLEFPVSFPLEFNDVTSGGRINADNAGNFAAPLVMRLDGALVNPKITLNSGTDSEQVLELNTSITASQFIVLDSSSRTVMLNGTQSRYYELVESDWFDLAPGSNEVSLNADSGTGTLSISWRSTFV